MGQDPSMWHDTTGDKDVGQHDKACRYDADIMIRHCGKDITGTSACWYIVHLVAHLITHTTSHTHRTLRVPAGSERAGWGNDGLQILRGGRMGNARTCRLVGIDDGRNAGFVRGMQSCQV